jgi:SAM-dependent methyltransferase
MTESNDWGVLGGGAEIYETVFVPALMGEWASRGVALANLRPGERVLDVASGTGALTRLAAKSAGPNGRVVGLDLSPDMLDVARTIAPEATAAPIEWREGDVGALPFADDSFDAVFCAFGLMFFPDRIGALKEMVRVLRPDGRVTLMVWGSMSKCPGQLAMKESWTRHFGADAAGLFDRQHSLGDPIAVRSLIDDAGFRNRFSGWPRILSSFFGLTLVMVMALVVLMPSLNGRWLGLGLIVPNLTAAAVNAWHIRGVLRTFFTGSIVFPLRVALSYVLILMGVIGGISVMVDAGGGLIWPAIESIGMLLIALLGAWSLLVGVAQRSSTAVSEH